MYHKKTVSDEWQLSSVKDGVTKEITNRADLDTALETIAKTITSLFLQGKCMNIAIVSEEGNVSKVEISSFTPSNF